jgi:hypothetical protein
MYNYNWGSTWGYYIPLPLIYALSSVHYIQCTFKILQKSPCLCYLKLVILSGALFPSTRFMSSYFSWKSFSLFHRAASGKNSSHCGILELPLPCCTHPSRLRHPFTATQSFNDPSCQGFHTQGEHQLITRPPLWICNLRLQCPNNSHSSQAFQLQYHHLICITHIQST